MALLSATSFFTEWVNAVNKEKQSLLTQWGNASEYTKLIKANEDCILQDIANVLGLKCYAKDYYYLDAVLYSEGDLVPGIKKNSFWLRQIKVAFEHENNFSSGLYQEVAHLLLIQASLKVLVTYPNCDTSAELAYLHKIICECDHQTEISEREDFLLIFGYGNPFKWDAFIYKENGWQPLMLQS